MNLKTIRQPFTEIFPGDLSQNTQQRQTPKVLFATVDPEIFPSAQLLLFNEPLAEEIGLGKINSKADEDFLNAQNLPENITTYATAYAGNQFGNWAGQLGDGRAIFAGEIKSNPGKKTEIQWKGAGATPYSRFADGRAVFRSTLREYLMSEAMHFLKIPTTRALSLSLTGEDVLRDKMYDGNPEYEKGALMIRTAESFLRFGHFELLSSQKELDTLQDLADFTVDNYFPEIKSDGTQKYKDFFQMVCQRTADLMVNWYRIGFVHGVMNTDNMSVLGLTIDYGPFSMLDEYDLNFTSNTTDLPGRRYAFGRQAEMAQWNLWMLANALFPLIQDEKFLEKTLDNFSTYFWEKHDDMLAKKFGLDSVNQQDEKFFTDWQTLMHELKMDYTIFFTELEKFRSHNHTKDFFHRVSYLQYSEIYEKKLAEFLENYSDRLKLNSIENQESIALMQQNNPKFILRNYLLFECIAEFEKGNTELLEKLQTALQNPYKEIFPEFSMKKPANYEGVIGCSMLSCSS